MSTLKANTFTGTTSAGSILVTGEGGSTTTNLQQGLCKVWCDYGTVSSSSINDSFNAASLTDHDTGTTTIAFTNNMGNVYYSMSNCGMNGDHLVNSKDYTLTSSERFAHYNQSNSATDPGI